MLHGRPQQKLSLKKKFGKRLAHTKEESMINSKSELVGLLTLKLE
jgi:hypothetical protein